MEKYNIIVIFFVPQIFLLYADNTSFNSSSDALNNIEVNKLLKNGREFTYISVPSLSGLDVSSLFGIRPGENPPPPYYPWNPWNSWIPPRPIESITTTTTTTTTTENPYTQPAASQPGPVPGVHTATHSNIGYQIPCGVSNSYRDKKSLKIVGGTETQLGEFPWQVSLQVLTEHAPRHVCGGAIISAHWVVTAGHCVHRISPNKLSIVAGDYHLYAVEGIEQRSSVKKIVQDNYDYSTFRNDIALLLVSPGIKLDGHTTAPICLPDPSVKFNPGTFATATGWGRLSENGALAHKLQKVTLPIMEKSHCDQLYQSSGFSSYLNHCQLCAGYDGGGKDSCQGDSGGPLVCQLEDERFYLCGVVSWGVGCARPGFPGVYTLVPCYSKWISNVIYNRIPSKKTTPKSDVKGIT